MRSDEEGSTLEKINYHLNEASRLEHELACAGEGEATIFGKLIYGVQLGLESAYGIEE